MSNLPSGIVTFLFTDIEGSSKLAQAYPEAMPALLARHNDILRGSIEKHRGFVFRIIGDSFSAAFHDANSALRAAVHAQRTLIKESWSPAPVKVRMGIHTGEAQLDTELKEDSYSGYATLALTQRIMSAGHGGQILLSQSTYDLTRDRLPEQAEVIDLGERRLKDFQRPERIYQLSCADLPSEFAPLQAAESRNSNLPMELTSFIGREKEHGEVQALLHHARLLTLIGPGGTGKTRLSLHVAARQLAEFSDGVWLIEFAPLADPAFIPSAIASVFGLREVQGMPIINVLIDYLRARSILLIFDNCEHVVDVSAQIADQLLHACPQLKIIASSREALGIDGESIYRVPSLLTDEATRLFVERAVKAESRFVLTETNAAAIAQICTRLDGIPLAIELAAARVKLFTPEQIAERLSDRFKLLSGGSRSALPRQQTLRALIDWSYQTLNIGEQEALRRLAVFAGGWSFEAAEQVIGPSEAMDGLQALVNKSLVNVDEQEGRSRYRFLETIRQYAMEKLLESGESEEMRDRHLAYYLALAERAEAELLARNSIGWITWLESENDNLRGAIEWGMERNPVAVLRIAGALPNFWFRRGYETEGRKWIQDALERVTKMPEYQPEPPPEVSRVIAKAYQSVSFMAFSQGDMQAAKTASRACAALARRFDDYRVLSMMLVFEAASRMMSGEFEGLDEITDEALEVARKTGDRYILGMSLGMLGSRMIMTNRDIEKAQSYAQEGLLLLKDSGNYFGLILILFALGMAARFQGHYEEALSQFDALLPAFEEIGDKHRVNMLRSESAHIEREQGHFEKALQMYRETIVRWQALGHRAAVAHQLESFAMIAKAQEQPERAAKLFGAAEVLRDRIQIPMTAMERIEYDRQISDLRAGMDERAFVAAWAQGRELSLDQAVTFALAT